LKYEQDCYEELLKTTPRAGSYVETKEGKGVIEDVNVLTGMLKVRIGTKEEFTIAVVSKDDVKVLKEGNNRNKQMSKDEIAALKELEKG
jgi:cell fate regulator YaaT (PSP1 superfamily)